MMGDDDGWGLDDSLIKTELEMRRQIYNKFSVTVDDFGSKVEYDDFLEKLENIIYDITHGINADEARQEIIRFKKENAYRLDLSRAKKAGQQLTTINEANISTSQAPKANASTESSPASGLLTPLPVQIGAGLPLPLPLAPVPHLTEKGFFDYKPIQKAMHSTAFAPITHPEVLAGGWSSDIISRRYWSEAFSSLLVCD